MKCEFWLCRLIGHNPIPTVAQIRVGAITFNGNGPRRWSCSRSMVEIGYRD